MIRSIALYATLATLALSPAALAAQSPSPVTQTGLIEAIDEATLLAMLERLGAEVEPLGEEGEVFRALFPNGSRGVLRRTACTEDGCKGLLMLGYYRPPAGATADQTEAARRDFSANYNPASVITNDKGEHIVKSYIIFDGGVTDQNLYIRLAVFADSLARYSRALYGDEE
jgi:hypothetical protein